MYLQMLANTLSGGAPWQGHRWPWLRSRPVPGVYNVSGPSSWCTHLVFSIINVTKPRLEGKTNLVPSYEMRELELSLS